MVTMMMDTLCTLCGAQIKWVAEDQCFICRNSKHGIHRQFEKGSKEICHCPDCYTARAAKETVQAAPFTRREIDGENKKVEDAYIPPKD